MYTGVDIVEIARVERLLARHPVRFPAKVFTAVEQRQSRNIPERLAALFAAKEATMKLLGTGWRGLSWKSIEVGHKPSGQPYLTLSGGAADRARALGIGHIAISLTHSAGVAVAVAVAAKEN